MHQYITRHHRSEYLKQQQNKLWEVEDAFIDRPELKLHKKTSPLIEMTVENWGTYQFENAPSPPEMVQFVRSFVDMLHLEPVYTCVEDVCHFITCHIEYEEPYFFLVDTLVQLSHNEFANSYKHRKTGIILDLAMLETYRLVRGWEFKPYHTVRNMMDHPGMQLFLTNNVIPPQFKDREHALTELLKKISEVVWGPFGWLDDFVERQFDNFIDGIEAEALRRERPDIHEEELYSVIRGDYLFWLAATLGVMTWLKGPAAVGFLAEYHIIYGKLLGTTKEGKAYPLEGTGDEAIVDGIDVYTRNDLEFIPGRSPDTCVCCGVEAHCTKHLNITALFSPTCSCGEWVDPHDQDLHVHHSSKNCRPYRDTYPEKTGYVCQRCIFKAVNKLPQDIRCGRAVCPALRCPHHMGADARVRALTIARTRQLTSARVT